MKKLLIALLILITLSSTVFNPVSTKKVDAKEAVRYVDRNWDDEAKKVKQEEKICTNYSVLDKDSKVLDGWCVVNEDVKADHILWVKGTANIIICDGVELECDAIRVNEGETLNIYSQSGDSGKLKVDYRHFENASAIGGGGMATSVATDYVPNIFNKNIWVETIYFSDPSCGAINIYGGIVDVKVSNNIYTASGIGGGGSSFSETSYTNGQIYKLIHDGENGYENLGYYEYKKESEGGGFDIKNFIRPLQDVEDHKYTLDKVDLPYSESKKGDIAIYGGKVNELGSTG